MLALYSFNDKGETWYIVDKNQAKYIKNKHTTFKILQLQEGSVIFHVRKNEWLLNDSNIEGRKQNLERC
jgi:hypothetical protein